MKNKKNRHIHKPNPKPAWPKPGVETPPVDPVRTLETTLMPPVVIEESGLSVPVVEVSALSTEPLLAEVQSFLAKRIELARRMKEEIAATELRLEQLRRNLASLMPERAVVVAKDKKLKKVKPIVAPIPPKPETESAQEM